MKLCGFLLLLGLVFGAAHVAGARLGPVTGAYSRGGSSPAGPGTTMNMGGMGESPGSGSVP